MPSRTETVKELLHEQQNQKMQKKHVSSFELYLKPEELTLQRCQRIVKYARKRLRGQDNNSVHAYDNSHTQVRVPIVSHSQVELGNQLGKGAFSSVYAIKSITKKGKKNVDDELLTNEDQSESLVVKFLRTKLYDNHGLFAASAADLVKEGNILSTLSHTNIIRIHAVSSKYGVGAYLNGYHDSYFLVLERLERTLSDRIVEWQSRHKALYEVAELAGQYDPESVLVSAIKPSSSNSWKKKIRTSFQKGSDDLSLEISDRTNATQALSEDGSDYDDENYTKAAVAKTALLAERLDVAQQLADAIAYLHSQNVLHRDLKPDNIGFDIHGDLKVFDFDIARVCPTSSGSSGMSTRRLMKESKEDETFLMTQKVGSPRYMSPECARREPYNLKADVYSFAVLAHQILTLQKPYDDVTDEDHDDFVFVKGVRPFIPVGLPTNTKTLFHCAWSHNISERPNMETVRQALALERTEILRLGTIGQSLSAIAVAQSTGYVWSCSFAAISDNNKRVKKIKAKPQKVPLSRKGSFKSNKKNGLLSIFRKNLDKPVKKNLMSGSVNGRMIAEGTTWARR
jgi:serine/threonine protein kinase